MILDCQKIEVIMVLGIENSVCPSVCLSVCLSVTLVNCDKMVERSVQIFIPYERTFSLVF